MPYHFYGQYTINTLHLSIGGFFMTPIRPQIGLISTNRVCEGFHNISFIVYVTIFVFNFIYYFIKYIIFFDMLLESFFCSLFFDIFFQVGVSCYAYGYQSVTPTVPGYLWLSKLAKKMHNRKPDCVTECVTAYVDPCFK